MTNQPPQGYDPRNPYGQGQSGASGTGDEQSAGYVQQGNPPPGSEPGSEQPGYGQQGFPQQGYEQPGSQPPGADQPGYPPEYPSQPMYPPPPAGANGQPAYPPGAYTPPYGVPQLDQRAGFAIGGLVLGIASIVLSLLNVCDLPIGLIGLVLGIVGLSSTTRHRMAVAAVVLSAVGLVLAISVLVFGLMYRQHTPYTP